MRVGAIVAILIALAPGAAAAQSGTGGAAKIEYGTVAEAMTALRARSDVKVSERAGWTFIEDAANRAFWSFTPSDHAAHPSVVKREIVERDGVIHVETNALCEAEQVACDRLIAEFHKLNRQMRDALQAQADKARGAFVPSAAQKQSAERAVALYLKAIGEGRYADAYAMLAPEMTAKMRMDQFVAFEGDFHEKSGGGLKLGQIRVSWYKDPPNASAPGVYAAFDILSRYDNIERVRHTIIVHEAIGQFRVLRHERNILGAQGK